MPKQATGALISYLNSKDDVVMADLYTILLEGGGILRYVDFPLAQIVVPAANIPGSPLNSIPGNVTFLRGPRFGRSKVATKIGIEPAELDIDVFASTADLIGSLTLAQFVQAKGLDGAILELDRFFMPVNASGSTVSIVDSSLGAVVWFYGKIADIEIGRSVIRVKVKSLINILQQQQMPRRLFQSGCTHIFGDAMCGYDRINGKNALGVSTGVGANTVTALTGSSQTQILVSGTISSVYQQGTLKGLSGTIGASNSGLQRGVQSVGVGFINLTKPFPFPVTVGDTFQIIPGCDHTANTCNSTFQNLLRYGGFDYIPPPELAI